MSGRSDLDNKYQRVYETVSLYAKPIIAAKRDEEKNPDLWFVIIPDFVKKYCRPKSTVESALRIEARKSFGKASQARRSSSEPFLFEDLTADAEPYFFKAHTVRSSLIVKNGAVLKKPSAPARTSSG